MRLRSLAAAAAFALATAGLVAPPAKAVRTSSSPSLLLRVPSGGGGRTLIRTEPFLSSWRPVGLSACLAHEPAATDLIDHTGSTPLPAAIDSNHVIGCDVSVPPGRHVVDFNASNSPNFARFVERLTNGVDETIWDLSFLVDENMVPFFIGGGGCPESCSGGKWKPPRVANYRNGSVPDLQGYTVDSIRLVVKSASWSTEPASEGYYLVESRDIAWEVYGRPAAPGEQRPPKRRHHRPTHAHPCWVFCASELTGHRGWWGWP